MENVYNGYDVYAKINDDDIIIAINSSAFITNYDGWTLIGTNVQGDKGHHAQGNYLDKPLVDDNGIYNYKLVDGVPVLRTDEDKQPELDRLNALAEIAELKAKLAATDYIAAKLAEVVDDEEKYATTKKEYTEELARRTAWRVRINELEQMI